MRWKNDQTYERAGQNKAGHRKRLPSDDPHRDGDIKPKNANKMRNNRAHNLFGVRLTPRHYNIDERNAEKRKRGQRKHNFYAA